MDELNLRPVWHALLDVCKEIEIICRRHNLRYWAAWGTLLGAVRHEGFIPWDDDLDLMMPREDYDLFLQYADRELPEHMKIISIYNTKEYRWGFCKVQDCRRELLERVETASGYVSPDGIYVDIYPMDGCLDSSVRRFARKVNSFLLKCRQHYLFVPDSSLLIKFFGFVTKCIYPSLRTLREFMLNDIKRLSSPMFCGARYCAFLRDEVSRSSEVVAIPVSCFKETIMHRFEDTVIPIPSGYDEYLRRCYGDYMKLPPLEKRCVPSHANDETVAWRFGPTGVEGE